MANSDRSDEGETEPDPRSRGARSIDLVATTVIIAAALLAAADQFHATQDDSFISYRHAKHLVDMGSLTFNGPAHERVEGCSNFTWTLLLALAYAAGIGPVVASKLLGLACLVATILGAMRLTGELLGRYSRWRLFAGVTTASSACLTFWSVQGLETPLIAALVVWSLAILSPLLGKDPPRNGARRAWIAGAALGLVGVSRPETAIFGVVALAGLVSFATVGRGLPFGVIGRLGIAFALPVLAQLVFRLSYYGRVTANPVYAKVHGDGQLWRGRMYLEHFIQAQGTALVGCGLALLVLALFQGARRDPRSLRSPAMLLLFLFSYVTFIVAAGGDWMPGFRFFMHVFPLLAVAGTWSLARSLELLPLSTDRRLRVIAIASAMVAVLCSNLVLAPHHRFGAQGAVRDVRGASLFTSLSQPKGPHWKVGEWLADNLTPDSLVALSEAGIVPFVSDLPVLDYLGLNDRRVADLLQNGGSDTAVADYVFRQQPRAIVLTGEARAGGTFVGRLPIDGALQNHADFERNYRLSRIEPLAAPGVTGTLAFAIYLRR